MNVLKINLILRNQNFAYTQFLHITGIQKLQYNLESKYQEAFGYFATENF